MKVDSKLICRREPYGPVCAWEGDERHGTATVNGSVLRAALLGQRGMSYDSEAKILKWGGLRLRVLGMAYGLNGCGADLFYVKSDNPHSQLYALYRRHAERLLRFIVRVEAAVRVFRELPIENVRMPFTEGMAAKLL